MSAIKNRHRPSLWIWLVPMVALIWCTELTGGQQTFVRQNVASLTPAQVTSLRNGIQVMMARGFSDPTSYRYQANIHGTRDGQAPLWSTCQHGSWFFFSWHRMYLYYFERILRKASGDPTLTLPYWRSSVERSIPLIYRQPARATNPLYVFRRCGSCNAGTPLPAQVVDTTRAFRFLQFSDPQGSNLQSFGGDAVFFPQHTGNGGGALEITPHNAIHAYVGGTNGGWMADPDLAARDPLFWAHHSQIDHLWGLWLDQGSGRVNPTDSNWLNTQFSFFDENGNQVVMTANQILDSQTQLGYVYDDDTSPSGSGSPPGPPPTTTTTTESTGNNNYDYNYDYNTDYPSGNNGKGRKTRKTREAFRNKRPRFVSNILGSLSPHFLAQQTKPGPVHLRKVSSKHVFHRNQAAFIRRSPVPEGSWRRSTLKFTGIDYQPGAMYEVYLHHQKDNVNLQPLGPNYVGIISPFALRDHPNHPNQQMKPATTTTVLHDVSHLVEAFDRDEAWLSSDLNMTFVSISCDSSAGTAEQYDPSGDSRLSFQNVELIEVDEDVNE